MFDIGMTELLLVAIVALIVVGPKDLPGMFRTLGRFTAKAKGMAREFSSAMEQAADESGVKDIAKTVKSATNPKAMGLDAIKGAAEKFESWDPAKNVTSASKNLQTAEMTESRTETAKRISEATAKASRERRAAEAAGTAATSGEAAPAVVPKKPAAKKAAVKKPAVKKPAVKKPAAKPAAAKTAAKTAAKKPAVKKPAVKKPAAKKAPVKTAAAKAAKAATKDESAG